MISYIKQKIREQSGLGSLMISDLEALNRVTELHRKISSRCSAVTYPISLLPISLIATKIILDTTICMTQEKASENEEEFSFPVSGFTIYQLYLGACLCRHWLRLLRFHYPISAKRIFDHKSLCFLGAT